MKKVLLTLLIAIVLVGFTHSCATRQAPDPGPEMCIGLVKAKLSKLTEAECLEMYKK